MASLLNITKRIRRRVRAMDDSVLHVEIAPEGLWLWEPRRRRRFLSPWGFVYQVTVRAVIDSERAMRVKVRRRRRAR